MKKVTFCCFLIISIVSDNYSQTAAYRIPSKPWRNLSDMETIDTGNIRIWYALNAKDIKNPDTFEDYQRLEIGENLSRYYSYFVFFSDSLCTEWGKKNKGAASAPRSCARKGKTYIWTQYYYSDYIKDFPSNRLTVHTYMALNVPDYQYSEDLPIQDWTLHDDTLTVAGQLCQKATCRFRGRDFTAWFAPEIPIGNGPWKFGGLPGLIMKVYDSDNLYVFECCRIEKLEKPFPIKKHLTKYSDIDKEKYDKLTKDIHYEHARKFLGYTLEDGSPYPRSEAPYHPLELE